MDAPPARYVKSGDGYSIAYTQFSEGQQPLVFWGGGVDSAQLAARFRADWIAELAVRFRLIYVDMRGSGLSQRGLKQDLSQADFDRDVETVAEQFPDQALIFFTRGMMGHPIVRFADRHPGRVQAIVWVIANMTGGAFPLVHFGTLSRENWRILLDSLASTSESGARRLQLAEEFARNIDLRDMKIAVQTMKGSSVEEELARLAPPLLVMHPRDFVQLPPAESMRVAALAPHSRFVLMDGAHWYRHQEIAAIDDFLSSLSREAAQHGRQEVEHTLSSREFEVLRLLAAGKSNPQIAEALVISESTVAKHVSSILAKTESANRTEAAVYAKEHGLA